MLSKWYILDGYYVMLLCYNENLNDFLVKRYEFFWRFGRMRLVIKRIFKCPTLISYAEQQFFFTSILILNSKFWTPRPPAQSRTYHVTLWILQRFYFVVYFTRFPCILNYVFYHSNRNVFLFDRWTCAVPRWWTSYTPSFMAPTDPCSASVTKI